MSIKIPWPQLCGAAPSSRPRHCPSGQARLLSSSSTGVRFLVIEARRTGDERCGAAAKNAALSDSRILLDDAESWQNPAESSQQMLAPQKRRPSLAAGLKWTRRAAQALGEALFFMDFEDPGVKAQEISWRLPTYKKGLSGWELLAEDISTIKHYYYLVWLQWAIWQAPLQPEYDPEELVHYFGSRPHLLMFRALEVSAAFSYLFMWFLFEKCINRMGLPSDKESSAPMVKTATVFKGVMVQLGPTFVKVAQALSTRSDLVGPDTARVLADLQDRLPPFPTDQAVEVIEQELGRPVTQVFSYFSGEPVAAASLGQVYKARTVDGEDVAVKVQRPGVMASIARDVYILRIGLGVMRKVAGINSDLSVFADEIGRALFGELDYRQEAANAAEFQAALASKLPFVVVPRTLRHLTSRKVLTMEWITGTRPVDVRRTANGEDGSSQVQQERARRRLIHMVNKGVQSSLTQLLDAGLLHADPHPGNLLYTPDNKIGYLDFGLICRLEKKHQHAMFAATAHLVNGDWNFFVEDLGEMDVLKPSTDRFGLELALDGALSGFVVKRGLPDFRFSEMIGKLLKIALKFRFRIPPYYMLILRSIASLEGMALAVDPNFKVFTRTYPFVIRRLICDKSLAMRRTLRSLLLTAKREFRWDRIASFMALPCRDIQDVEKEDTLESTVWKLLSSSDGAALRRIILEADTKSLAQAFLSKDAAPARLKVRHVLMDAFYSHGQQALGNHIGTTWMAHREQPGPSSVLKNRHLGFLVGAMWTRLRPMPFLMARVALACLSIVSYAGVVAGHRLAVDACSML